MINGYQVTLIMDMKILEQAPDRVVREEGWIDYWRSAGGNGQLDLVQAMEQGRGGQNR